MMFDDFDVAVDDVAAVRLGKRVGDFKHVLKRLVNGERAAVDGLLERAPFDVLHHEEERALGFVDFVNRADVRMINGRSGAGFAHEAGAGFFVADEISRQSFDGDDAV
jgi:hypothetical protein